MFIGKAEGQNAGLDEAMDVEAIKSELEFCLLTAEEMRLGRKKWKTEFDDPFELEYEEFESGSEYETDSEEEE